MTDDLCGYTMRYPNYVCYILLGVGLVFLIPGLWRLIGSNSSGEAEVGKDSKTLRLANIHPILLVVLGVIFLVPGLIGIVGSTYSPAGRWLTDVFPLIAEDIDSPVKADLHDHPLEKLVDNGNRSKYTIRLSEGAQNLKVTGTYSSKCTADLIDMICTDLSKQLVCSVDSTARIIRVCAIADKSRCTDMTL